MGYTEHVGRGARRVLRRQYSDHFSLSLLPLFEQAETPCPRSPPFDGRAFSRLPDCGRKCKKRQARKVLDAKCAAKAICKKPFKVCSRFVHNLPPEMRYTDLAGRENTRPPASFFNLFSFFHLFFLPSFSFCIGTPCPPDGGQGASICPGKAATNLSQAIQNLFTHCAPRRSILNTSAGGSRKPHAERLPIFISLLPPLFQICVVNRRAPLSRFPQRAAALCCMPPEARRRRRNRTKTGLLPQARGAPPRGGSSPPRLPHGRCAANGVFLKI